LSELFAGLVACRLPTRNKANIWMIDQTKRLNVICANVMLDNVVTVRFVKLERFEL